MLTHRPAGHLLGAFAALALLPIGAAAQTGTPGSSAPAPAPQAAADALGRTTPRGTVFGFLAAARKGDNALASHYLNTTLSGPAAEDLAHQLFVVLDTRLPARLTAVSDVPEGSRQNLLEPDENQIGSIEGPSGPITVVVQRVGRRPAERIWLFSTATLAAMPSAYAEISAEHAIPWAPRFLQRRVGSVRLLDWLAIFIGLPGFYLLTVLLNRALTPMLGRVKPPGVAQATGPRRSALPMPARLLLLSVASRWLFTTLPLSLLTRQVLSHAAVIIGMIAVAWLVVLLNGEIERRAVRRLPPANFSGALSLLRVGRRIVDIVVVLAAVLAILGHFGVDVTPLLAGLGVGGIAVALAAQKTLENVIAGASLILDQAVRVGDFLRIGPLEGTVDHIGLRSTRIRTPERTIVSVPNGQIATMSLETLSARDKFWFHPLVGLRYETTTEQMRAVLDGIRTMLVRQTAIDGPTVRVRFLRLGAFSMDVEVFAYVFARDWPHFLEIQEELLFAVTGIVRAAGTEIAFPSQTMYVRGGSAETPGQTPAP